MKKFSAILLAAAALLVCSCYGKIKFDPTPWYYDPADNDTRESVSVMSFNIRYQATEDTGVKNWSYRKKGIFAMLEAERPLAFGVQEMDATQMSDLLAGAPDYAVESGLESGKKGNGSSEYVGIFYLRDSVSVVKSGTFWLCDENGGPQSKSIYDGCTNYRIATWAILRKKTTGTQWLFINTHLENGTSATAMNVRTKQLLVLDHQIPVINPNSLPWCATADWNAEEKDEAFFPLIDNYGMKSARSTARRSDNFPTFNNFGGSTSNQQWDHVFYSGFPAASSFKTLRDKYADVVYLSDHYPVIATLRFDR